jgi:hypothetical protein
LRPMIALPTRPFNTPKNGTYSALTMKKFL